MRPALRLAETEAAHPRGWGALRIRLLGNRPRLDGERPAVLRGYARGWCGDYDREQPPTTQISAISSHSRCLLSGRKKGFPQRTSYSLTVPPLRIPATPPSPPAAAASANGSPPGSPRPKSRGRRRMAAPATP